jgi:hypothetical protein
MTKAPPVAVSPAIGPIPAIHVPAAPGPASLLWRAAARVVRHLPAPIGGRQLAGLMDAAAYRRLAGA